MFAGCAALPAVPRKLLSNSPYVVDTFVSQAKKKGVAETEVSSKAIYRFISLKTDVPTSETASIGLLDTIDRPSIDTSKYLGFESLDGSIFNLDSIDRAPEKGSVWERLIGDQSNFYSKESMLELGFAFGAGALFANTDLDNQIQKHFQSSVQGATSDDWFQLLHSSKELGNGVYTLPIFGAAWLANETIDGGPMFETVGQWGERAMRGFLVGGPPMILMQRLTGGSRPYETIEGSEWHPFQDNNGVSGHAFMSSLPFITAAKLTDSPLRKTFWYTASTIGPLSRMNDNAHYPSQIGLGWAMAFVAATAVNQTDTGKRGWSLAPQSGLTSSGVALQYRW